VGQQPEEQVLGADTIMTEFPRLALSQDHRVRGGVVEPLPGCRTHDLSAHASIVADQLGGGGWTQTTSTTIMAVVPPTRRDCGGANDADVARTELASLAPDSLLSATTAGHRCDGGGRRRQWGGHRHLGPASCVGPRRLLPGVRAQGHWVVVAPRRRHRCRARQDRARSAPRRSRLSPLGLAVRGGGALT